MGSNSRRQREDLNQTPKPPFYVNPRLGGRSPEGQDPAGRRGPLILVSLSLFTHEDALFPLDFQAAGAWGWVWNLSSDW